MEILDANVILRYLLLDNKELSLKAKEIIENSENLIVPIEVVAEVVYVLQKVYKIEKEDVCQFIIGLLEFENIQTNDPELLKEGIAFYQVNNIDFVDSILCSYAKVKHAVIHTFDKKINTIISRFRN